jgi:hypothetical protein
MLKLTDSQIDAVLAAARPLAVEDRDAFLQEVAERLTALPHLGDGVVHRVVAEVQQRHWDAPVDEHAHGPAAATVCDGALKKRDEDPQQPERADGNHRQRNAHQHLDNEERRSKIDANSLSRDRRIPAGRPVLDGPVESLATRRRAHAHAHTQEEIVPLFSALHFHAKQAKQAKQAKAQLSAA